MPTVGKLPTSGIKRGLPVDHEDVPAAKRGKLFEDTSDNLRTALDEGESLAEESDNSVRLKINSGYAKRFEHNKEREELQRRECQSLRSRQA